MPFNKLLFPKQENLNRVQGEVEQSVQQIEGRIADLEARPVVVATAPAVQGQVARGPRGPAGAQGPTGPKGDSAVEWQGTETAYNALSVKDANTTYYTTSSTHRKIFRGALLFSSVSV